MITIVPGLAMREVGVPGLRIIGTPNVREHWAPRMRRTRQHRHATYYALGGPTNLPDLPVAVTLTRLYAGRLRELDDDNLVAGFKHVRDEIADLYKIPDNDPRIRFACRQERGERTEVRIRIEPVRPASAVAATPPEGGVR